MRAVRSFEMPARAGNLLRLAARRVQGAPALRAKAPLRGGPEGPDPNAVSLASAARLPTCPPAAPSPPGPPGGPCAPRARGSSVGFPRRGLAVCVVSGSLRCRRARASAARKHR